MAKYRRKRIVNDAIQFTGENAAEVYDFIKVKPEERVSEGGEDMLVPSSEGPEFRIWKHSWVVLCNPNGSPSFECYTDDAFHTLWEEDG